MTANHARAIAVANLQSSVDPVRLKRHDALKILAHDEHTQNLLVDAILTYQGVTTYTSALHVIKTEARYQVLCTACGWSLEMICPECAKGCGCDTSCTGWRHGNYAEDFSDDDPYEDEYHEDEDELHGEDSADKDEYYDDDYDKDPLSPIQEEPEPDWPEGDYEPVAANGEGGSYSEEPPF